MISIAIIENTAEIRESLDEYFNSQVNFLCQTVVDSVEEFLKKSSLVFNYDIIILDINIPGIDLVDSIKSIKEKWSKADVIMFTVYNDQNKIFQALCAGATGYIFMNVPFSKMKYELEECYAGRAVMSPQIARKVLEYFYSSKQTKRKLPLTEKEKQVIAGLVNGLSYKTISVFQKSTEDTILSLIKNIYKKLYINSNVEIFSETLRI